MRTLTSILVFCMITLAACKNQKNHLTGEDQLTSALYTIDPTKDTTLTTAQGAVLTIAAGTLDAGSPGPIQLEVKEAYSLADILRGRLLTNSQGHALSSGGMIYINAAGGKTVTIRKPIKVAIPTKNLQDGMQVYKGKRDDKGDINWLDPKPLAKNAITNDLSAGKSMFRTNCASCHSLAKALTAEPLAWVPQREPDKKWLHDFIRNNQQLRYNCDGYSQYLHYCRHNMSLMPLFPELTDKDIDNVLLYIANESETIDSNTVPNYRLAYDSCARYLRGRDSLLGNYNELKRRRDSLITDNHAPRVTNTMYDANGNKAGTHVLRTDKPLVEETHHIAIYYEFTIDSFGWFNIDMLVSGLAGVEDSKLTVTISGSYGEEADVFLVIPALKIYQQGGYLKGKKDVFGFFTADGKLPLPQGVPAFVICMGEKNGQPFFGKQQWITSRSQDLQLAPATMTKEAINQAFARLAFEKMPMKVADSKNAAQIRIIDTLIQKTDFTLQKLGYIKPEFCDCGEASIIPARDTAGCQMLPAFGRE